MRVSEKSLELNFCANASLLGGSLVWFGLTQRQEAMLGFDVATRHAGRLLVFQMKAPSRDLSRSRSHCPHGKQFALSHRQLSRLQQLVARHCRPRTVFYAFPLIRTTLELSNASGDVLSFTQLVDVRAIPPLSPPTTKSGGVRKSGIHYANVSHTSVVLHSEPIEVETIPAGTLFGQSRLIQELGAPPDDRGFRTFVDEIVGLSARPASRDKHASLGRWYGLVSLPQGRA